jgi:hypothetical protein
MGSRRKLPDIDVLKAHAEEGMSNQDIGERYGVTSEAVRQAFAKEGIVRTPERASHLHYIPWSIRADHVGDTLARRLRSYSKKQQGRPLTEREERLLDDWVDFMEGSNSFGLPLSVHYSRTDPDGFWLEPRRSGDRDYISPPQSA